MVKRKPSKKGHGITTRGKGKREFSLRKPFFDKTGGLIKCFRVTCKKKPCMTADVALDSKAPVLFVQEVKQITPVSLTESPKFRAVLRCPGEEMREVPVTIERFIKKGQRGWLLKTEKEWYFVAEGTQEAVLV